jgi:alcohol dehydrogenase
LTVVLGIHPTPRTLPLHPMELFDGRRIVACTFGDFKGKTQLPLLVDQCMQGVITSFSLFLQTSNTSVWFILLKEN